MRLGLHVGYWGLGLTAEQQLEVVKEAESAGYDSVWAAEAYGSDTATVLAWIAGQTEGPPVERVEVPDRLLGEALSCVGICCILGHYDHGSHLRPVNSAAEASYSPAGK